MERERHYCTHCGRDIGYDGVCYFCRTHESRRKALTQSLDERKEMLAAIIANIKDCEHFKNPYYDQLCELLSLGTLDALGAEPRDALIQAALANSVYYPPYIYAKASGAVRDELLRRLNTTDSSQDANSLLRALAFQADFGRDSKTVEALFHLEQHPLPWREKLFVDPSYYMLEGGFTFDHDTGAVRNLTYPCYALEREDWAFTKERFNKPESAFVPDPAVQLGLMHSPEERCPHCGGLLTDMVVLDASDPRFSFLGKQGKLTFTCCLNCLPMTEFAYAEVKPDAVGKAIFPYLDVSSDEVCYFSEDDLRSLAKQPPLLLSKHEVNPLYAKDDYSCATIGGIGNYVQDAVFPTCPHCHKPMKLLAQLPQDELFFDFMEGTVYVYYCEDCDMGGFAYQQT